MPTSNSLDKGISVPVKLAMYVQTNNLSSSRRSTV